MDLNDDIIIDERDNTYALLLFDSCQKNFCFNVHLKPGVDRPAQGQRFELEVARTPDHGRNLILNPATAEIVA